MVVLITSILSCRGTEMTHLSFLLIYEQHFTAKIMIHRPYLSFFPFRSGATKFPQSQSASFSANLSRFYSFLRTA
ncbi:hypothetical protein L596_011688 [Steinernema carpocapsae]|uniref:Uncharacterized protein n=1 Tax=Steinernema carpocapsae TaxID=34508 RepID=A0A4U5NVM4_STECR|nr:hypothetical protein L596_011688 [Steinernema carpocapsae]